MIGSQTWMRAVLATCVMIACFLLIAAAQAPPTGWSEESHGLNAKSDYDLVFPESRVLEMTVTLENDVWEEIADRGQRKFWTYGSVHYEERTWPHVRVVITEADFANWQRGLAAPNLQLEFGSSNSNEQRFYGFAELQLHSSTEDPSLVRSKVALDLLRDAGVPSPHAAFYSVRLEAPGAMGFASIYTCIEVPAAPMLDEQFDEKNGALYRIDGQGAQLSRFDPDAVTTIQSASSEFDVPSLEALIAALHANRNDRLSWRMDLEAVLDVYEILRWLAVRTVFGCNTGYGRTLAPVILYWDPGDMRFHWVPSAPVQLAPVAEDIIDISMENVSDEWPLIRRLADDPAYRGTYLGYVDEVLHGVMRVGPAHERLRQAHVLLEPYVLHPDVHSVEHVFLVSPESFALALQDLLSAVEERYAQAVDFLRQVGFSQSSIVISEIHYNPSLDQGIDNNFEFVELFNHGYRTIDLSGYRFIEGLQFALPPRTLLSPGQCLLLTKRAETYRDAPCEVQQWERGSLSNGGETLRLVDREGVEVDSVRYDDVAPWPESADAGGSSLEIVNPNSPNYTYENWRASLTIGGSPGWVEQ